MLRAVFFDAAGTLFEAREPVGGTYARVAREFGLDAPDSAVTAGFRRAFGIAPPLAFGPGRSPDELRRLERQWWRMVVARSFEGLGDFRDFDGFFEALFAYFADPANWRADDEARALLDRLKSSGLKLGVISNFDYRVYRILESLELKPFFDSITISSEAGYAKPRREVFEAALAAHRVRPEEAIHVGDSQHLDFDASRAAGIAPVLVDPGQGEPLAIAEGTARIRSLAYLNEVTQVLFSA
ncbi:MAG: HAD-IA family hydrolase [Candidatus Binataceae bacterium]